MDKPELDKAEYVLDKPLGKELCVVRRVSDGELFLCHEFDIEDRREYATLRALYHRGAYTSAAEVLNHENLISLTGPITNTPLRGWGGGDEKQRYLLWDWCDAGTLDTILREPPVARTKEGFLPESLVWHVALSTLKALMWLHEGWRERYDQESEHWRSAYQIDDDWMPILHREIEPRNIYFQSPRGVETYGRCKLGNFGNCYVSGSVSSAAFINETHRSTAMDGSFDEIVPRAEPVVTIKERDAPLQNVKQWWKDGVAAGDNFESLYAARRPYTTGSELFAVGAIMYRMMTGWRLPSPDGCHMCECTHFQPTGDGCKHDCLPDIYLDAVIPSLTQYSEGLRSVLERLLNANRNHLERAVEHYGDALSNYWKWKTTTPDGKTFRDDLDDKICRLACAAKRDVEKGQEAVEVDMDKP